MIVKLVLLAVAVAVLVLTMGVAFAAATRGGVRRGRGGVRRGRDVELDCRGQNLGNALSSMCHAALLSARTVRGCTLLPDGFRMPLLERREEDESEDPSGNLSPPNHSDMIHENRPGLALAVAGAMRAALTSSLRLPSCPRDDKCAVVYLRCSDVPVLGNQIYELIEYEWYLRALALLPVDAKRRVLLRSCLSNPLAASVASEVCAAYAAGLREAISDAGYDCELSVGCGDLRADFLFLCASAALIVGGCGGSFGFWAAALSPETACAILPTSRSPRFLELGAAATSRWGNKVILRAERVRGAALARLGGYGNVDGVLRLCRSLRPPRLPPYDGHVRYINRTQDAGRREHMERELAAHGFVAERVEPAPDPSATKSLTMTHLRILVDIAERRGGWTMVCEDDVSFGGGDALALVRDFAARANMFAYVGICMRDGRAQDALRPLVRGRCAHAYLVCPEGAAYLAWILRENGYAERGEHIDVVMERHVRAPLLRPEVRGVQDTHRGLAFQDRSAPWYSDARSPV
jgi:hypothetical protein